MNRFTQFEIDGTILHFADHKWHMYNFAFNMRDVFMLMGTHRYSANDTGFYTCYKAFSDQYGITPSKWRKVFNAKMTDIWRIPDWALFAMFTRTGIKKRLKIDVHAVRMYFDHKDICDQLHKDGIENLLPFVMYYGIPPHELRKRFGKSTWRIIANNSKTRNHQLVMRLMRVSSYPDPDPTAINKLLHIPTTLLPLTHLVELDVLLAMHRCINSCKQVKQMCKDSQSHLFFDTMRMAQQLGRTLDVHNMTLTQWEKKHKEFSEHITKRKHSPEPFDNVVPHVYEKGEYQAIALISPYEVAMEGHTQHHCVASYIHSIFMGRYLVYRLNRYGQHYGTIGVSVLPTDIPDFLPIFTVHQIQGSCNSYLGLEGFNSNDFLEDIKSVYRSILCGS